ncbi:terminase large subunit domain-containing protein [Dongia sp.]|uniref:terminase large subunit domain-containing protein n=1 Tax=Dongia sp. TaxID=1977262 RepID=UPI0035B4A5FC
MIGPALQLYDYQRKWIQDKSRFKIGMFARQTGKTFTTTQEIVDDCFEAWSEGRRARWVILSRGERQAKEAMDTGIKLHAKAYQAAANFVIENETEYDWRPDDKPDVSYKALEITLAGGSRITALPANPDTARGFSANVFLDEFAFHKDSREIWKALFPVISAGWKIRVTSTPNGKGNKFYELMTARDSIWSRHTVDIYQAVADGLPRDIEALKAGINDDEAWAQEFLLEWADEATSWLTYDLITACEDENAGRPDLYQGGQVFIGNDIARRNNLWVAWVLELVGDVLWTREIEAKRNISFAEQDLIMDGLAHKYRMMRLAMDQGGMGEKPVEDAKLRYGELRVDGVLLQGATRLNIATVGKQKFEDRKIRIPMGDTSLRADLHKVRKVVGETGGIRLVADDDAEGHADRFWAGMLAMSAAQGPTEEYGYQPANAKKTGGASDLERDQLQPGGFSDGAW